MKILIEDYSNILSTEPQYLHKTINSTNAVCNLWNTNHLSVFDVMDLYDPDILICHYTCRSLSDIIKYFKNSNKELILNISNGIKENSLSIMENIFLNNNIKCKFFILNDFPQICALQQKKIEILNLLPAADIFIPYNGVPDFKINTGIITTPNIDKIKLDEYNNNLLSSFHKIVFQNTQEKISELFDYSIDIFNGCSVYNKYENLILNLSNKIIFSQLLFDVYLRANNVILKTDDQELTENIIENLFGNHDIKNQVKQNHTCINRTIELFKKLQLNDDIKILEKLQTSI